MMQAVRSSFKPSRTWCRLITACCSQILFATKRIVGREARLADRRRVSHVVLATLAFHAVRADEVGRDQPRVQAHHAQVASPVVRARARLYRHQAARRQLRAPSQQLLALDRARHKPPARTIHCVDLNHVLRHVHTDTYDKRKQTRVISSMGLLLFNLRLMTSQSSQSLPLVHRHRQRIGEVPSYSLKRSANGRPPGPGCRYAAHFRQPGAGVLPSSPAYLER